MKPFYLYILRRSDGSYYTGHTDALELRMQQHAQGAGGAWTARRRPVELVYTCEFQTRLEALERERQIKGWSRAKKLALITGDWQQLRRAAARRV